MTAPDVVEQDATEALADEVILLALLLQRFGAGLRRRIEPVMAELLDKVLREVAPADLSGPGRFVAADRLGRTVTELTRSTYSGIAADLHAELRSIAVLISQFLAAQISDGLGVPGEGREVPPERLAQAVSVAPIIGATLAVWLSKMAGDAVFRLRGVVNNAAANSLGGTETITGIRDAVDISTRNFNPIIRSAITAVFAAAMTEVMRSNGAVMAGWVHVSVLDGATSDICRTRAGRRFRLDGSPIGHKLVFKIPPLHMNCRSHLAPWFRPVSEMPPSIRHQIEAVGRERAFTGRPVVDATLDEWLRRRPEAEQRRIVGEKRLKEWRAGRIGVSALLDQAGRPLTLTQVRKALGL